MQAGHKGDLMRTTVLRVACLGLVIGGSGLIVASAQATGGHYLQNQSCSLATLEGFSVFSAEGLDVTTGEKIEIAQAGYEIYDGKGGVRGLYTISEGGIIFRNVPYTGTYTVNPDCSGTLTTLDQGSTEYQHFDQFIMPSGKEFRWVQTDEGIILSGDERRSSGAQRRNPGDDPWSTGDDRWNDE